MHRLSLIIVFLINAAPKEQRHNDASGKEDSFHASMRIFVRAIWGGFRADVRTRNI